LTATIKEQLLDADTRPEEPSRIWVVQRIDREIARTELARG
jgi:hypothetical protein